MSEKLLTIREVASVLNINEKEVIDLAEKGVIPAYKVGGVYLRFKKDQVELYKKNLQPESFKLATQSAYAKGEYWRDFFYFYDFYIFSALLVFLLLGIIIKG